MTEYRTHVFDMDGTLLVSNGLKAQAFREAAMPYGEEAAEAMVALHQSAGSISRRERVERFFAEVLGLPEVAEQEVESFLERISAALLEGYRAARVVPGVERYLDGLDRRVVVTGVEEGEARALIGMGGIRSLWPFVTEVYGCPPDKAERLQQLVAEGRIEIPAVYYGDTAADYEAAREAGLDFVLVTCDAEWDWRRWAARRRNVRVIEDFRELLPAAGGASEKFRVRVGRDGTAMVLGERRYFGRMLAGALVTVEVPR